MGKLDTKKNMAAHPKYKKEYCDQLPDMFASGESVVEVCVKLKISRAAFYEWCKKYPDFGKAAELGKDKSEAWWTNIGRVATVGKLPGFQSAAWVFTMKNRFSWRDQPEIDLSEIKTTEGFHIHVHGNTSH